MRRHSINVRGRAVAVATAFHKVVSGIGPVLPNPKNITRNMLCPCGSGLKYKRCHRGRPMSVTREQYEAATGVKPR